MAKGKEDGFWLRREEDEEYEEGMVEDGDESGNEWRHRRMKDRMI